MKGLSKCISCNFMMGSAAVVEQLWSKAGCVCTSRSFRMPSMAFEMIMFLKENEDLWNLSDIVIADDRRKDANKESRANKKINDNNTIEQLQQLVL